MAGHVRAVQQEGRVHQLSDVLVELGERLRTLGYTYTGVADLLGATAHSALSRNETTPGPQATADGSPLATLVRLWPLQASVTAAAGERALPRLVVPLCSAGILERSADEVRAALDVRPYADDERDWWVVSDLTPGLDGAGARVSADYVLGISSASSSLAQLTVREPVEGALDLGTGCGVQSLHLAGHAHTVVGSDVNPRALRIAAMNAALNGIELDVREGSLFEPVDSETFDLIVSNPPFVVSPATGERLVYRDSGLPGDELVRRVVTQAPQHLRPGGWCHVLANWVHLNGQAWDERLASWLEAIGCDAWVVQREVADPAEYVELWLKDAGVHGSPDYTRRYDAWLSWFTDQRIEGVGFGWFNLRRTESSAVGNAVLRIEDWPYQMEQPLGPEVAGWGRRTDFTRATDDAGLLDQRLTMRPDVRQETVGEPGAEDPERIILRQSRGMRRARQIDTVEAGLVGACDGELPVGAILDALASILERDVVEVRREYLRNVRELLADGFLEPTAVD